MKSVEKNMKINKMDKNTITSKIANLTARGDRSLYLDHLQRRLQAMNS